MSPPIVTSVRVYGMYVASDHATPCTPNRLQCLHVCSKCGATDRSARSVSALQNAYSLWINGTQPFIFTISCHTKQMKGVSVSEFAHTQLQAKNRHTVTKLAQIVESVLEQEVQHRNRPLNQMN